MSRAEEIIGEIQDSAHKFDAEGLLKRPDEFTAVDELQKAIHKVRQVFEQNEKME